MVVAVAEEACTTRAEVQAGCLGFERALQAAVAGDQQHHVVSLPTQAREGLHQQIEALLFFQPADRADRDHAVRHAKCRAGCAHAGRIARELLDDRCRSARPSRVRDAIPCESARCGCRSTPRSRAVPRAQPLVRAVVDHFFQLLPVQPCEVVSGMTCSARPSINASRSVL